MPRQRRQPDPHAAWLAGLHPALRMLAEWRGWEEISGGTLVVACSGGRDSVTLAHCAWTLLKGAERENFAAYLDNRMASGRLEAAATGHSADGSYAAPELLLWHFDHGLRDDSHLDAQFVRELGAQRGMQVLVDEGKLREQPAFGKKNTADLARGFRYASLHWLLAEMNRESGYPPPHQAVLAQHMQDQAETVLFNLVRGTGVGGLLGMGSEWAGPEMSTFIHRPWLRLASCLVQGYAEQSALTWREDPTNKSAASSRSLVRHKLLPLLQQLNPHAVEHIANASFDLQELQQFSQQHWPQVETILPAVLPRLPLLNQPGGSFIVFRLPEDRADDPLGTWLALRWTLNLYCGGLNRQEQQKLREWLAGSSRSLYLGQRRLERRGNLLTLEQAVINPGKPYWTLFAERFPKVLPQCPLPVGRSELPLDTAHPLSGVVTLSMNGDAANAEQGYRIGSWWEHLALEQQHMRDVISNGPPEGLPDIGALLTGHAYACRLPASVAQPLALRSWRQGDRIRLAGPGGQGSAGSKKLSDVFVDAGIPRFLRQYWMLLVDAMDEVIWAPGLADSQAMASAGVGDAIFTVRIQPGAKRRRAWELRRKQYLEGQP